MEHFISAGMSALRLRAAGWWRLAPGLMVPGVLALAASYVSGSLGGPVMLFALLFGMAFNFLAEDARTEAGLDFTARTVLRIGVALLGARITMEQVADLGLETVALVVGGAALTIVGGLWIGRRLGLRGDHAILSAGAVAICGASAALAISSVLPRHKSSEQQVILTVVGITTLSTIAMVIYPPLSHLLGFDDQTAGVFLGATIHDVAQVVGAGHMISDHAGQTAAIVKLLRVMCLMPVVVLVGMSYRKSAGRQDVVDSSQRPPLLPGFMVGFVALVAINSLGWMPVPVTSVLGETSRWCLLAAVSALGVKTELGNLFQIGARPVIAMILQTAFLALLIIGGLLIMVPA